ncbi:MAG: hypothetical protein ACHQPI_02985 [Thermoanaerobaculia bacterium]
MMRSAILSRTCDALALALTVGLATSASAVGISQTFRNSTAPGWNLVGTAVLTSGGVDPAGVGWLRLTSNAGNQAGTAIYNTPFSSTAGVQVIFTYATYGGSGADGISFYLIDGATAVPTVGSYGGPLGYSKKMNLPTGNGVTNGYLGIGLDEYGNFGTWESGDCSYVPCSSGLAGVTIRGSGSLFLPGFNYYTQAAATIPTGSRAGAKRVRITITPAPTVNVTVEMDSGSGFVTVINNFNISGIAGQAAIPATFKMGLAGSTGDSTDFHEIRDFTTTNADPTSGGEAVPTLNGWMLAALACLLGVAGAATMHGHRS